MLTRLAPRLIARTTLPATRAISADALAHTAPKDTEGPLFTGKKEKKAEAKRNDTGDYKPKVTKGVRSKLATGSSGKGFDELKKRHDEGKD
ncbi:uncharacterized protein LOC62_07G009608 [Vanrija pseudolonga]|uniref:Uncharacterized protein n=1 Tax=Vanrija pseudolonga TaxID=143232 RepID=A0AAF0YIZ4_9TREE|nr:hypothetical protein LOC62_07G009608 [Vanrija pseudolonga]